MDAKFDIQDLNVYWDGNLLLKKVTLRIPSCQILGVIGPAGSGKTTFIRSLDRMNELEPGFKMEGRILLDGEDIYAPGYDAVTLRKKVGMVFALPVALPMSIYENIVYGPRLAGIRNHDQLGGLVEQSLQAAFMWDEVKDRLEMSGLRLSGGQQQRLCLARVLAMEPEVILLDEPCSGLDPISTAKIEEALTALKKKYTIILVTNNTKQAARIADQTAFFLMGELIEIGPTDRIFTAPIHKQTDDYVTGRFG
ncbi:MAG TPA: phosphate ABC transporter ATP-binding protein [Bacteroidetes bacterium]|nr:phosphate ABC transporter ATP-binding protein [Bacteroidota bacterium]